MFRAATIGFIVLLMGLGYLWAADGGIYLAGLAVVLAYVRGRMDESDRLAARHGGLLPPFRQSTLTEFERARGNGHG